METWKKHWGAHQWAAFFETKTLPVLGRTKELVATLEEQQAEELAPHDLALVVLGDPLLCLQLLREAERIRTNRLGNETTTTPLAPPNRLARNCSPVADSAYLRTISFSD